MVVLLQQKNFPRKLFIFCCNKLPHKKFAVLVRVQMLRPTSPRNAARRLEALAEISSTDVLDVGLDLDGLAPRELRGLLKCHEHVIFGRVIDLALRRPPAHYKTTCLFAPTPVPPRLAYLDLAFLFSECIIRVCEGPLATHPWMIQPTTTLADDAHVCINDGAQVYLPRERRFMARRDTLLRPVDVSS